MSEAIGDRLAQSPSLQGCLPTSLQASDAYDFAGFSASSLSLCFRYRRYCACRSMSNVCEFKIKEVSMWRGSERLVVAARGSLLWGLSYNGRSSDRREGREIEVSKRWGSTCLKRRSLRPPQSTWLCQCFSVLNAFSYSNLVQFKQQH